jgi:folylpolyglutamate synthase/dihydropteroate synthase
MPKQSAQTPNWQPLSRLPLLAGTLDRALVEAEQQLQNLQKAQNRPSVLDDRTIERVIAVFGQQKEIFAIYQEQFAWWKAQQLCPTQQREISRLEKQLERLHTTIDAILSLAEQLKEAAIEKVLGKSALERALSVLSGKPKLLSNLPCRRSLSLRGMVICIPRRRR